MRPPGDPLRRYIWIAGFDIDGDELLYKPEPDKQDRGYIKGDEKEDKYQFYLGAGKHDKICTQNS